MGNSGSYFLGDIVFVLGFLSLFFGEFMMEILFSEDVADFMGSFLVRGLGEKSSDFFCIFTEERVVFLGRFF